MGFSLGSVLILHSKIKQNTKPQVQKEKQELLLEKETYKLPENDEVAGIGRRGGVEKTHI